MRKIKFNVNKIAARSIEHRLIQTEIPNKRNNESINMVISEVEKTVSIDNIVTTTRTDINVLKIIMR